MPSGATLVQLDPTTSDTAALAAWQTSGGAVALGSAQFKAEWVAQPSSLSYGTGTVVTSPQPASVWPPGAGTSITSPITQGALSMVVASTAGMSIGGFLGLDYFEGQPVSPMAEVVQITSISGLAVGITACVYPHGGGLSPGLVAVPVSATFMNQQARDMINFLAYPPIAHLFGGTASLAAQVWPAATALSWGTAVVDNFSKWNGSDRYTFPVSGVYYVYGQLSTAAAQPQISVGFAINGGGITWGSSTRTTAVANSILCATIRRHIRVQAGQFIQLFGSSNVAVTLPTALANSSRLIVVFRGF